MLWSFAIVVSLTLSNGAVTDPSPQKTEALKPRLDAVVKRQAEDFARFLKEYEAKATENEQKPVLDRYTEDVARNTGEILALVRAHPDDPSVVEALRFVIVTAGRGPGTESYQAMEILLRGHLTDPGMGEVCGRAFHFRHAKVAEDLIRGVLEKHPNRQDRGLACHTLATYLWMRAGMIRAIRQDRRTVDDYVNEPFRESTLKMVADADLAAIDREREALLERTIAEFGDVKDWFTPDRTLGAIAEGELFATRNLEVGQVAPQIEGKDHEGKSFTLHDFRGKVVVLTFSASTCGPCVAMYPQLRELVRELADKPFAMVCVNADKDLALLKKPIEAGEITWRCWWDGGLDGQITTRWGVSAIPEIYVLDRLGVIRHKNLRGKELARAIKALLKEEASSIR